MQSGPRALQDTGSRRGYCLHKFLDGHSLGRVQEIFAPESKGGAKAAEQPACAFGHVLGSKQHFDSRFSFATATVSPC
jgi:hypothetical protein